MLDAGRGGSLSAAPLPAPTTTPSPDAMEGGEISVAPAKAGGCTRSDLDGDGRGGWRSDLGHDCDDSADGSPKSKSQPESPSLFHKGDGLSCSDLASGRAEQETELKEEERVKTENSRARSWEGAMSLRPCLTCGALTRTGSYCAKHRPPQSPLKQRSGRRQQTFRRKTLQRYGLRCIVCGSTENVEAAHDLPLDMTPGREPVFGVPLCRRCHRKSTRRCDASGARPSAKSGGRPAARDSPRRQGSHRTTTKSAAENSSSMAARLVVSMSMEPVHLPQPSGHTRRRWSRPWCGPRRCGCFRSVSR